MCILNIIFSEKTRLMMTAILSQYEMRSLKSITQLGVMIIGRTVPIILIFETQCTPTIFCV